MPQWLLERLALTRTDDARSIPDPLAPHDRAAAIARLDADPAGPARLDAVARSSADILAAHPPAEVVAEIERRLRVESARAGERARAGGRVSGSRAPWWRGWGLAAAGAACAAALAVVVTRGGGGSPSGPRVDGAWSGDVRAKGDPPPAPDGDRDAAPRLIVHRKRGASSEVLAPGTEVRAGDRLQLAYVAGGYSFGAIVSIDGRGVVTLHYPDQPGGDTSLSPRGPALLSRSYELDDAPGFERFFFVVSRESVDVPAVLRSAERLAADPDAARRDPLELPGGSPDGGSAVLSASRTGRRGRTSRPGTARQPQASPSQRSILLRKANDR